MNPLTERCSATAKGTGLRCERLVVGGGVCIMHGGRAPQVAAAREARVIAARAQLGGVEVERRDPGQALLAAAADADVTVQRLKAEALGADGRVSLAHLAVLGEWLDRIGRLAKLVLDARVDERQVALEEARARLVAVAFNRAVTEVGLGPGQRDAATRVFLGELRTGAAGRLGSSLDGDRPVGVADVVEAFNVAVGPLRLGEGERAALVDRFMGALPHA